MRLQLSVTLGAATHRSPQINERAKQKKPRFLVFAILRCFAKKDGSRLGEPLFATKTASWAERFSISSVRTNSSFALVEQRQTGKRAYQIEKDTRKAETKGIQVYHMQNFPKALK